MVRIYLVIFFLFSSFDIKSQCLDFKGNLVECPTFDDSLTLYNNSIKILEFFENNENYKLLSVKKLSSVKDVMNCFYKLDTSLVKFQDLLDRRKKFLSGEKVQVLMPRDGKLIELSQYYRQINETKFYQREFENGILNLNSPFPLYDTRIAPLLIHTYINNYGKDEHNGDEVQIALYIPVTIKPLSLLTEDELLMRNKILSKTFLSERKKFVFPQKPQVVRNLTLPSGYCVYYGNGVTSCLIGFISDRKFIKIPKKLYTQYAVPNFGRSLLENEKELKKFLKALFGDYLINGI